LEPGVLQKVQMIGRETKEKFDMLRTEPVEIKTKEEFAMLRAGPVEIKWHPGLPIYACEAYMKSLGDEYGWIGGTDASGETQCVLPYTIIRKPGFRMVRFLVQTIPLRAPLDVAEERAFLNSVVEYFRSTDADIIIPSGNTAIFQTYPDGAAAAPYGTIVKDLDKPEAALMSEIRTTHRQNIRKAAKAGVQIKSGPQYLDASYDLVLETMQRSNADFKTHEEFNQRIQSFGEYVKVFVAEHEGVIQGCMVSPFSEDTAYSCYAGSKANPIRGAMHLLHWEAICQFRELGVRHFDFQGVRINPEKGSKQEGLLSYKQGFGGRLVQGFLWKYSLRPLKSMAYSLAVRLLKGGDFVDQEKRRLVGSRETT
jgi:hypothetical protein